MDALLRFHRPIALVAFAAALVCFEAAFNPARSARSALVQLERTNQKLYDLDGPSPFDPPRSAWKKAGYGTTAWMESPAWKQQGSKKVVKGKKAASHASPAKSQAQAPANKKVRGQQQLAEVQGMSEVDSDPLKGRPDFAPASASLGAGFGYAYAGALPPESWPSNFDGENFVSTNGDSAYGAFVVEEPMMDGSYWLAAHEEDPQPTYPAEEDASTTFADLRWNNFAWCGSAMCDITSDDPIDPPNGEYVPGVPLTPY